MRYMTAQQIFDSVAVDFKVYDEEGMIDYFSLIKVIKRCNSDLSLAINPESEDVIKITDYKGRLPLNYESLNFALLCTREIRDVTPVKGFQIEQVTVGKKENKCSVCLEECETDYKVIQRCDKEYVEFDTFDVVKLVTTSVRGCGNDCMNLHSRSRNQIKIQGDYVHTNFQKGTVYVNYVTNMVDEDGNLLVLDHPFARDYYELACKVHILQSLHSNSDDDVERKLIMLERKLNIARGRAIGLVQTPEFTEIGDLMRYNRMKFVRRYSRPFDYGN